MGSDRGSGGGSTTKTCTYYKNDGSGATQTQQSNEPYFYGYSALAPTTEMNWTREGYTFLIWNTSADGTGTDYAVHQSLPTTSNISLYAIWVQDAGPDIEITYKGVTIATLSASGTKTLETEGKYCEDDITVTYTKSGGGSGLPDTPGTDGTYALMNTVASGTGTVSWVKPLVVTVTNGVMSSTFEEISDAFLSGRPVIASIEFSGETNYSYRANIVSVLTSEAGEDANTYRVYIVNDDVTISGYTTFSRNGYPEYEF